MTRAAAALLGLALLGSACAPSTQPAADARPAKHLVVVTIDTLRADRVGVYGNPTVETPVMDRLAREGAFARHASVHVPLTRPSHVSLFSGLYPGEHQIRDNVSPPVGDDVPLLADLLQRQGFSTAGFVGSIVLSKQSGLNRGFATYSDDFDFDADDARFLNTIQKPGDVVMDEAIGWLRQSRGERRFLWVHLYDPHDPYEPPEPYRSKYADRPYDGEVAWSDALVGRLDAALADAGLRDDTLLVVTSDHGEGLEEHGESVHGYFVYETTLAVPFIARGPGVRAGHEVPVTVRTVDVLPTVLELLGLGALTPPVSGRSLAAALGGAAVEDQPTFAESLTPLVHYGWSDLRAVRDGRWKYILAPREELYDLARDPGELENLAAREPARARALRSGLEEHLRREQAAVRQPGADRTASVPPELLERLGALGYVSAGGPAGGMASGADPKDKLDEYQRLNTLMREGLIALRERRFDDSLGRFRALLGMGIDSFEAHYYAARALTGLRRWKEAAAHYEGALAKLPAYGAAHLGLAQAHLADGNLRAAREAARRGQAAAPRDPRLIEIEGDIARRQRDAEGAVAAYRRVVEMAPADALIRIKLGELYRDLGRTADAVALLRAGIAVDPSVASYWNSLGMVLGGSGDFAGAEQAFLEASTRDRANAQYAYNLGLALLRQRKVGEARAAFEQALKADPAFAPARERLAEMR
ncbi:MAG: sulfatase-like hydrolase/transferase [Acidobacteriota bacterium]